MAQANRAPKAAGRRPRSKPGVKREEILRVAIEAFGRNGYEDAKWADIATAVGIGPTALYHYFESKQHCLFEIMAQTVADYRVRACVDGLMRDVGLVTPEFRVFFLAPMTANND